MNIESSRNVMPYYEKPGVPSTLIRLPRVSPENISEGFPFAIMPSGGLQRGVSGGIIIDKDVFDALHRAQKYLSKANPNLLIVLKRGYFPRDWLVRLKEKVASKIFAIIYPSRKHEAGEIFSNDDWGHYGGFGVDLGVYDRSSKKYYSSFLPPENAFSSNCRVEQFKRGNPQLEMIYQELCGAVKHVGFSIHTNEIEARQMHVMLPENGK